MDQPSEGLAFDLRHREEEAAFPIDAEVKDGHDRGVLQAGHEAGFGSEAHPPLRVGEEARAEQLHGDVALQPPIVDTSDLGHAAEAEVPSLDVAVGVVNSHGEQVFIEGAG
jgi:hypothetical protein